MPEEFAISLLDEPWQPLYVLALETAQGFVRSYARMVRSPDLANTVRIHIETDPEFQARAWQATDSLHRISISAATPALVLGLFFEVTRFTNPFSIDPAAANDAGDGPGNFRMQRFIESASSSPESVAEAINTHLREASPELKWQKKLAFALAEVAMVFVATHELSHIVLGHTRLLAKARGLGVAEVGAERRHLPGRISRAWELAADQHAFSFLWSYAFLDQQRMSRLLRELRCNRQDPILSLVSRLSYAASFIFLFLSQGNSKVRMQGTHPSSLERATFLATYAATLLEAQHSELAPRAFNTVTRAHDMADAAWLRLGLDIGRDNYQETIDDLEPVVAASMRHLSRLKRAFGPYAWRKPASGV